MTFLIIKKRLRQAASRGKLCFSRETLFGAKKKRLRQASSRRKMFLFLPNKGAIGSPQQGSHWFTQRHHWVTQRHHWVTQRNHWVTQRNHWVTQRNHWFTRRREPLVLEMLKNTKIFTKWSSIQHFEMIPKPKCTVFKTLHESDRAIAPKPQKWRFKKDFFDRLLSHFWGL